MHTHGDVPTHTHLHHVVDVIGQPEQAEDGDDGQDEFLTADLSAEARLSETAEDAHVAPDDQAIREHEANQRFKGVVENQLHKRPQYRAAIIQPHTDNTQCCEKVFTSFLISSIIASL